MHSTILSFTFIQNEAFPVFSGVSRWIGELNRFINVLFIVQKWNAVILMCVWERLRMRLNQSEARTGLKHVISNIYIFVIFLKMCNLCFIFHSCCDLNTIKYKGLVKWRELKYMFRTFHIISECNNKMWLYTNLCVFFCS